MIVYGADGTGAPTTGQPIPFDRLWLLTAGVVALLLLVQLVRIQSLWRSRQTEEAGNEMSSGDVETDE